MFKVQGRLYHCIGSLLPQPDSSPVYAQLYIYDPQEALDFRMNNAANTTLNRQTMQTSRTCFIIVIQVSSCTSRLLSSLNTWDQTSSAKLLFALIITQIDAVII